MPPAQVTTRWTEHDVVASPEWFGAGMQAFRELMFRRSLATALVAAHPRVWSIVELPISHVRAWHPAPIAPPAPSAPAIPERRGAGVKGEQAVPTQDFRSPCELGRWFPETSN